MKTIIVQQSVNYSVIDIVLYKQHFVYLLYVNNIYVNC